MAGERPSLGFWACGVAGTGAVLFYSLLTGDASGDLHWADLLLAASAVSAAMAYALGGEMARRIGGWEVISMVDPIPRPRSAQGPLAVSAMNRGMGIVPMFSQEPGGLQVFMGNLRHITYKALEDKEVGKDERKKMEERLELYRAKKPYRDDE